MTSRTAFVPGGYWTAERADSARTAMAAIRDSPQMQAMMQAVGDMGSDGDPAAAVAGMLATAAPAPITSPIDRERVIRRRGMRADAAELAAVIAAGEMPPMFIEPYVEGFLVIEYEGRIIGCGGLEFYGPDALIRSVVVDGEARGIGLGAEIGKLLEEDALASGARDVYLFTMHAWGFWKRLGYVDLALDDFPEALHENWQYQFAAQFPDAARDVHPMIKGRRAGG